MTLAQYLENREYLQFYKERVRLGKFVVLDSGVYENAAVSNQDLLHWCLELMPSALILPDKPHDAWETDRRSYRFAEMIHSVTTGQGIPRLWKVIHAEPGNWEQFATSYTEGVAAFQGVCFSRLTKDYGVGDVLYPRPTFINQLQERGIWDKGVHHHCLGMADGSFGEWHRLADLGINTCDSSAPIWRGVHGQYLSLEPTPFDIAFNPFWRPKEAHMWDEQLLFNLEHVGVCE